MGAERFTDRYLDPTWAADTDYSSRTPLPTPPIDPAVRAPLNYAYTAAEVMAALPRTEAVDVEALPAELQRKARDHGDPLNSVIASEQLTTRHRQDVLWTELARAHPITTTAAKYGAPAAACIAAVRMLWNWGHQRGANGYDIASAAAPFGYLAVALILAVLLTAIARRRAAKAPHWVYSDDELRTLDAASIDWPAVPEELDRYANGEVLRREWHGTWLARIEPGGAALVWREPHLVAVAALIARDIRSSATWNSELLDLHRVRVDLDRTLDDIYLRAHRIWRARANLVAPATSDSRDVVVRRNTEIVDAANDAWHTLVDLVRQLQDYRDSLAPVDALHSEIAALRQSNLRITDDALRQLHVDAAGNELRAYELYSATTDQADLNANLTVNRPGSGGDRDRTRRMWLWLRRGSSIQRPVSGRYGCIRTGLHRPMTQSWRLVAMSGSCLGSIRRRCAIGSRTAISVAGLH